MFFCNQLLIHCDNTMAAVLSANDHFFIKCGFFAMIHNVIPILQ